MILSGRQFREGRLLTGMEQAHLAEAAGINPALVIRAEATDDMPMLRKRDTVAIQRALEAAGVEFIPENGGGAGVRLRKVEP
ncbi:MAG: hypothetical protein ACRYGP_10570 [Janthinobacterium lividum]